MSDGGASIELTPTMMNETMEPPMKSARTSEASDREHKEDEIDDTGSIDKDVQNKLCNLPRSVTHPGVGLSAHIKIWGCWQNILEKSRLVDRKFGRDIDYMRSCLDHLITLLKARELIRCAVEDLGPLLETLDRQWNAFYASLNDVPHQDLHETLTRRLIHGMDTMIRHLEHFSMDRIRPHTAPAALQHTDQPRIIIGSIPFAIKFIRRIDYSCRWEKGFMEISRDVAEVVFGMDVEIVLHRRNAMDELYTKLSKRNKALVVGPPGCGKSACLFAMALSCAQKGPVLWIRSDEHRFLIIQMSVMIEFAIDAQSWDPLHDYLRESKVRFEYIFVDQCRLRDQADLVKQIKRRLAIDHQSSTQLLAITSDGCYDPKRLGFTFRDVVELQPWTLGDYLVVLSNANTLARFARSLGLCEIPHDELEKNARYKFYFAGISARFFFDYTVSEIVNEIHWTFRHVGSYDIVFGRHLWMASPWAVDVLFYHQDGLNRFSSRFVADRLLDSHRVHPETISLMVPDGGGKRRPV